MLRRAGSVKEEIERKESGYYYYYYYFLKAFSGPDFAESQCKGRCQDAGEGRGPAFCSGNRRGGGGDAGREMK